jgi:hypothetical protein
MPFQYRLSIFAMLGRYYGFDLRQLVSFAEVARLKSYRAAAARLNIAQPAISRQIQALEESLGLALFDRNNRRVILTKAGEWLNQELGVILTRLDQIESIKQNVSADPAVAFYGSATPAARPRRFWRRPFKSCENAIQKSKPPSIRTTLAVSSTIFWRRESIARFRC